MQYQITATRVTTSHLAIGPTKCETKLPSFELNADALGITSEAHAVEIARHLLPDDSYTRGVGRRTYHVDVTHDICAVAV